MASDMTTNTDLHGAMPELPPLPRHLCFADLVVDGGAVYTAAQMREYARAAIQQAAAPEGWKLVPVEPYPSQRIAGTAEWMRQICEDDEPETDKTAAVYRAMIAASPAPPKQQPVHPAGGECGGVPQWLPIETAPKDGKWILLAGKTSRTNAGQLVCRWDGADWESGDDGYGAYINPTHWKPLDEAPTGQINPDSAGQGMEGGV